MKGKIKKEQVIGLILAVLAIALVCSMEKWFSQGYVVKCIIKVSSFAFALAVYTILSKNKFLEVINLHKPEKMWALIGGVTLFFCGIAILFFGLQRFINLEAIKANLIEREKLTKENCLFAFAYITIFNSFLEEAFFRGFIYHIFTNKKAGAIVSAFLFSIYHITIFGTWFHPAVFVVAVVGLAIVGGFLQWLSFRYKTIIASWIVHASANVAINIIGALLIFEIL